ncbi:MAG: 50S ribosomal protein L14e [Nitrososphaerota archaeon]|nr:50S ribosomal protein L14e [Candidatus Bathyarchaeota archaeon]MCX8162088.1 50S ribosomal protein L14e [Candidatus Bathyarchaeota archaeon]MDW8062472.1 50S ribosomal protein L14e [Nitrososphaerota archaeon]
MIEVGRVCVKTRGREAGLKCVIVDVIDDNFVLITGPKSVTGVRRRRVNVKHLEPTLYKLEIEKGGSDESVAEAWKKSGLPEEFYKPVKPVLKPI